jgi:hypothetical protein
MKIIELISQLNEGGNVFAGKTAKISLENVVPTLNAYFEELKKIFPKKSKIFNEDHFQRTGSSSLDIKGNVPTENSLPDPKKYKGIINKDCFKTEDTGHFWVWRGSEAVNQTTQKFEPWMDLGPKEVGDIDLRVSSHDLLDKTMSDDSIAQWGVNPGAVVDEAKKLQTRARSASPEQSRMKAFLKLLTLYINSNAPSLYCDEKKVTDGNIFGLFPQQNDQGQDLGVGAQIDWMIGNLEWLEFSYHSAPHAHQSTVKGLHRTQLLLSAFLIAGLSFQHVGGVKDSATKKVLATNPDDALKLLGERLGFEITRADTEDYYKLHNLLKTKMDPEQYSQLIDHYLKKTLDSTRADIPSDLQGEWIKRQSRLGLTGQFLPDTSALAQYRTKTA